MMDRATLAAEVDGTCRIQGRFTLRSGAVSDQYFDKYRFEGSPRLLHAVAAHAAALVPDGTEVLAGLELGGVPVATALSLASGLPAAFVRKQAKPYGTAQLAEGAVIDGAHVLVVEDVISTGGQVVQSTADLRARGAVVDAVLCIIDRTDGDHRRLTDAGLTVISLFTRADLDAARAAPA